MRPFTYERAGSPAEAAAAVGDREAHVRGLARHPQLVQQRFEARVVAIVEDDEAGVDPVGPVLGLDRDRLGVATDPVARLVDDDVVLGGGNAKKLKTLPKGCRLGNNAYAFRGGFRMWEKAPIRRRWCSMR